jgi:SAM-dependent methyltransferase
MATATAQHYPMMQKLLPPKLRRGLQVARTNIAMFGYVSTARAVLARLIAPKYGQQSFDATHDVDTRPWSLADARLPSGSVGEAVNYEPAHTGVLHHMFRSLPFNYEEYHLVDLGSGKGRTLLVGAEYPFKAITGVELSERSAQIARDNISRNRRRADTKCTAVEVHCENAVNFTVPDGNLLVTMYNPFYGQTFQQCVEHLHHAAVADPARKIWLAYINPWLGESTLEQSGYFQRVQQHRPISRNWTWSLWQHV